MSIIKINAITVAPGAGDELARRFAARAGAVDGTEGFEGFELLRPTDDRTTWLVVTRWRDEAAFDAWRTSPALGHGHQGAAGGGGHPGGGGGGGAEGQAPPAGPAMSSELWSYSVELAAPSRSGGAADASADR